VISKAASRTQLETSKSSLPRLLIVGYIYICTYNKIDTVSQRGRRHSPRSSARSKLRCKSSISRGTSLGVLFLFNLNNHLSPEQGIRLHRSEQNLPGVPNQPVHTYITSRNKHTPSHHIMILILNGNSLVLRVLTHQGMMRRRL
jgi:hypothetical protein